MPKRQDLTALRSMIAEAKTLLDTSPELPQGRTQRAQGTLGPCRDAVGPPAHAGARNGPRGEGRQGHSKTWLGVLP
jgi:hypothetical protein